jgi:hypothetical protein
LKKVLIISPYFPPCDAPDMQRVRMSLPYFENYGWTAEIVMVNANFADLVKENLLLNSIPKKIKIHTVSAWQKSWTGKFGLGSIALRSLYFYWKKVNQILEKERFDLIYFSTTQFPVLVLGNYWKKKYGVPYVIDMQDPWHSNYYQDKPKNQRPSKHWFSYRLNKFLEPIAMKRVAGLISVSQSYLDTLTLRYPRLTHVPKKVITFGFFKPDFDLVKENYDSFDLPYLKENGIFNFVYIGRGGADMKDSLKLLFTAFKKGLAKQPEIFDKIRFQFIGTSYAPNGQGIPSITPIALDMGVLEYVHEQTDRISFYQGIYSLLKADHLLIIGSNDPQYTASKIFPYILAERPLLAFFNPNSSAYQIIADNNAGIVIPLGLEMKDLTEQVYQYILRVASGQQKKNEVNWNNINLYSAENMCKSQCELFNQVISN